MKFKQSWKVGHKWPEVHKALTILEKLDGDYGKNITKYKTIKKELTEYGKKNKIDAKHKCYAFYQASLGGVQSLDDYWEDELGAALAKLHESLVKLGSKKTQDTGNKKHDTFLKALHLLEKCM